MINCKLEKCFKKAAKISEFFQNKNLKKQIINKVKFFVNIQNKQQIKKDKIKNNKNYLFKFNKDYNGLNLCFSKVKKACCSLR